MRLKNPGFEALIDRISDLFANEANATWDGCIVIASERKLRMVRPG